MLALKKSTKISARAIDILDEIRTGTLQLKVRSVTVEPTCFIVVHIATMYFSYRNLAVG
jgi:hypothetical protein